ncbi:GntR family transcriptional regulator [Neorhizobium huautlense]|uniref:GntR family transcriptional regulator n=1 Tax=Neorhizobium huautlense TaxID=67774 RepID=A0ABT9PLV6_9HYPH|nr:GntR family transcriptional regulator [Neorhizobium huautlense]MDP9835448.1 GntR family transcriptional regulator [Neorhizobium huautlense]
MSSTMEPLKARRLYLLLREQILSGEIAAETKLPSEPTLAQDHGVSRVTVRRALDKLASDGMILRRPGAGTFVNAGGKASMPVVADFANVLTHLVEMGRKTGVKLISFGYVAATPQMAEELGLDPGEKLQRSVRVRLIDGQPFSYLVTHVPERIGMSYSEADLASTPLLELLERSGLVAERANQVIGATLAGPEVAAALDLDIGAALLSMTRVVFEPSGRGIEHLQALYRPDRYSFHMDLARTGDDGARRWTPADAVRTAGNDK